MHLPFLRNKSSLPAAPVDFSFLGTDLHSHLIPGIDDGSPDMETSVSLISSLCQMGYKKIITTPHVMQEGYKNNAAIISAGYQKVRQELAARHLTPDFHAAAEYLLDPGLVEMVGKNEPLLTISENKILLEFSFMAPPLSLHQILYEIQVKGYALIIAHPERYPYFHHKPEQYQKLTDMGCELQMNLLSLTGYYGKSIRKAALKLLDGQYVSYLGTDLHHQRHIEHLHLLLKDHSLMKKLAGYPWKNKLL
jgi:tyrosine-protein phosphatase YwqE